MAVGDCERSDILFVIPIHPEKMQPFLQTLLLFALVIVIQLRTVSRVEGASFVTTSSMSFARDYHTATLLQNGMVLIAGGYSDMNGYLFSAELYDPSTETWTEAGWMSDPRKGHTATLLLNGKVLVAGGYGGRFGSGPLSSSDLYDPATGTWTPAGALNTARYYHTATLLPNGKVLVAGGFSVIGGSLSSAELYDPITGAWTAAGALNTGVYQHTATLLPNGKVLVAGGFNSLTGTVSNAELYDPEAGTWTATGTLRCAAHTATLLPNGKVLIAGGISDLISLFTAQLYDPSTGTWTATGALNVARTDHTATLLSDGKVLVAGGNKFNITTEHLSSAELYDPATGTWAMTGSLITSRSGHVAILLANGKVLEAGGDYGSSNLSSAELYEPANPLGFNEITSQLLGAGVVCLSFAGDDRGTYVLESTLNLSPANWVMQQTKTADSNGLLIFTNTPGVATHNFWRVRSVP